MCYVEHFSSASYTKAWKIPKGDLFSNFTVIDGKDILN